MLHHVSSLGKPGRARAPELALMVVTAIWGATFLVVHLAMDHSGPLFFVGLRFLTAGVMVAVTFRRALRGLTCLEAGAGAAIGVTIALGYGLQSYGLQSIDSSTSAFITAMYVPLVPLLHWAVFRKKPGANALWGVALAFAGLVVLAGPAASGVSMGTGETATLIGAVAIAAEIVLIGHFAGRVDLRRVTVVQLLSAGAFALLSMPVVGESIPLFSWWWLGGALGLGAASALIQLTMNWAQKTVSSTRATIIYAGEPVWGGIAGRLAGERLAPTDLAGAALIVFGMLVSELKLGPVRRRPPRGVPILRHTPPD